MWDVWELCVWKVGVLCVRLLVFGSGICGWVRVIFWFFGVGISSSMGVGNLFRLVPGEYGGYLLMCVF